MSRTHEHDWDAVLRQANEMVKPHGFRAEYFPGEEGPIRTVGVEGDERVYLPVLCLIGSNPDQEVWAALSTKITNELPISRVTVELVAREGDDPSRTELLIDKHPRFAERRGDGQAQEVVVYGGVVRDRALLSQSKLHGEQCGKPRS